VLVDSCLGEQKKKKTKEKRQVGWRFFKGKNGKKRVKKSSTKEGPTFNSGEGLGGVVKDNVHVVWCQRGGSSQQGAPRGGYRRRPGAEIKTPRKE